MAKYDFECKKCQSQFEVECLMDELKDLKPKCPECKSKKVDRVWSPCFMFGPNKTLGMLAEKNSREHSLDAKDSMLLKQNKYRMKGFQGHLPDGAEKMR